MKKLLDSNWLRTVQFKCNTSANYTSKFWIMIDWKTIGTFPRKWYHVKWQRKFCAETEKSFLEWKKMASRKIFRHFLRANFFMFILLVSNHTVFLVQFGINLHLWVFQKRPHLQINSGLNSKPYLYLYKYAGFNNLNTLHCLSYISFIVLL